MSKVSPNISGMNEDNHFIRNSEDLFENDIESQNPKISNNIKLPNLSHSSQKDKDPQIEIS
jgi:hypothetical protein